MVPIQDQMNLLQYVAKQMKKPIFENVPYILEKIELFPRKSPNFSVQNYQHL